MYLFDKSDEKICIYMFTFIYVHFQKGNLPIDYVLVERKALTAQAKLVILLRDHTLSTQR